MIPTEVRPFCRNGSMKSALLLPFAILAAAAAPSPSAPRPPAEELRSFQFADTNLMAELAAAEPDVISPVALGWDAAGRMFVAEMRDYPNATHGGSIRLLEDRDGDGRHESAMLFADQLSFPNSVLPWNGGVLVTAAPDLLFLKDTDGDGRADERRVLFTGFGTGNQQLRANGLTWGFDGWVYGANGRSDGQVRRPGSTNAVSLRGRDFRFRPDSGEFETLAGRSQFGLAMDEWGRRFLSWNTIPVRHEVMPDRYLTHQALVAGAEVLADLLPPGDGGEVFPQTSAPRIFNNESSSHFNALSGLTLFRGEALGADYRGNAFVGESLRNLVHRRVLVPAGASFEARRAEDGTEFLRGGDPWFHPVNFATGPDGALYVVDFYREFVEHPDWVPQEMRDQVPWQTGRDHGRIWRVVRKDARPIRPGRAPNLAALNDAALVGLLETTNSWQRETAQRLLIERRSAPAIEPLRAMTRSGRLPIARFLAGQALAAQSALDPSTLSGALKDAHPAVRAKALELAMNQTWPGLAGMPPEIASAIAVAADDPSAPVRLWAALALRAVPEKSLRESALSKLLDPERDRWVRLAAISSSAAVTKEQVARWLPGPAPTLKPAPAPTTADPDRQRVVERLAPALKLSGNRSAGAAAFGKTCLPCHYLQGRGVRVGPDLSGISARPPEDLLVDLLDPSRQVAPEYAAYEITLTDGETVTGLYASETETRITVRRPGAQDANIPRNQIASLKATGKSLMPDGLETGMSQQDLADLISFLRHPDASLLPP